MLGGFFLEPGGRLFPHQVLREVIQLLLFAPTTAGPIACDAVSFVMIIPPPLPILAGGRLGEPMDRNVAGGPDMDVRWVRGWEAMNDGGTSSPFLPSGDYQRRVGVRYSRNEEQGRGLWGASEVVSNRCWGDGANIEKDK